MEPDTSSERTARSVVSIEHVTKIYPGGGGIHDFSLEVNEGEVFGFLGPNGAGKTTTIRLILDLIRPTSGSITVFGMDVRRRGVDVRRRMGYLPGDLALYDRLSAREILTHFAYLRGAVPWASVAHYVELFELELDRPVRSLSKGNRQKVGLVVALMGDPDVAVLDEPTSGLDPFVQRVVRDEVRRASGEGRTVLLSSHVLSEVGEMADRVGLIRDGRLIAVEDVANIRQRSAHLVEATLRGTPDTSSLIALPGVTSHHRDGATLSVEVAGDLNPLIALLAGFDLDDLSIREPTLEELFLKFYGSEHASA